MVGRMPAAADKPTLVVVTGSALLAWSLMLSQAMESVTRAFYARADLDLILSSPVAARRVFAVRIATMALSITLMALLLAAPFINMLASRRRALARAPMAWSSRWARAAALAVALTVALFRIIGPKRTRLVAQIVAAVIGAAFVIGLQVAAILSYGTLSRFDVPAVRRGACARARRSTARVVAGARRRSATARRLSPCLRAASLLLAGRDRARSPARFADHAIAAAGVAGARVRAARRRRLSPASPRPRCAARNGLLLRAIPGSCRRR